MKMVVLWSRVRLELSGDVPVDGLNVIAVQWLRACTDPVAQVRLLVA
jgi:hypothetical protein